MMTAHHQRLLVFMFSIIYVTETETVNKTAVLSSSETFSCTIQSSDLASWVDISGGNKAIFNMNPEREVERTEDGESDKYNHYTAELASDTQFTLNITYVNTTDGGVLVCENLISRVDFIQYNFAVEVPPDDSTVDCSSCTRASSSCNCQCLASGGSSPSTLRLEWKINDDVLANQPPTEKNTNRGQVEYSSSAAVPVTEDNSVVTCTVAGFENQDEITNLFPGRVEAKRTLSSPDCSVSVSDDNCPSVELSCSCDAYPSVPNSPEYFSYYSRQGREYTGSDTLLNDTLQVVTPGSEIYFVCTGDNGLNFTTKSAAVPNPCREATTPTPVKTDEPPPTKVIGQGLETYAIILIVLACVGAAGGTGFAVYWFGFRTSSRKRSVTGSNNDNTDGNGVNSKLQSEPDQVGYAAVNKPKSDPQPAPRSSKPPGNNTEPEKVELQYADIDHSNRGRSNEIRQPADEPTEYATVQSVIV